MNKLSVLIFCLLSLNAFSQTDSEAQNILEVKNFAKEKGVDITVNNESQKNRENKKFQLLLNSGVELGEAMGGVTLGYYLKRDQIISIGFSKFDDDINNYEEYEKGTLIKASSKVFTGNSFYLDGGLFYMESKENRIKVLGFSSSQDTYDLTEYKKIGGQLRIGNQWQWENFTLGCDWIGFGVEVADLGSKGPRKNEDATTYISLLNLNIGMAF